MALHSVVTAAIENPPVWALNMSHSGGVESFVDWVSWDLRCRRWRLMVLRPFVLWLWHISPVLRLHSSIKRHRRLCTRSADELPEGQGGEFVQINYIRDQNEGHN
jgi:hypothetical protein